MLNRSILANSMGRIGNQRSYRFDCGSFLKRWHILRRFFQNVNDSFSGRVLRNDHYLFSAQHAHLKPKLIIHYHLINSKRMWTTTILLLISYVFLKIRVQKNLVIRKKRKESMSTVSYYCTTITED